MAKFDPDKFHLALLAWCKLKKMPLKVLAEKMRLHQNSIYMYTKPRPNAPRVIPRLDRAAEIADVLEITLDELARGPFGEGLRDE